MDNYLPLLIALLAGLSVGGVLFSLSRLYVAVPMDAREYMDPLPWPLRLCWPLVRFLGFHIGERLPAARLEKIHHRLQATGVDYLLTSAQFAALQLIAAGAAVALVYAVFSSFTDELGVMWLLLAAVGGTYYPRLWLYEARKRRSRQMLKALPVYLDYITLAVEAGLNLAGALHQAVEKGPAGPLRQEWTRVLRDLRAGLPRAEALKRLAERVDLAEIQNLVSALVQAERTGASLGPTLRAQADQRRAERFQRAEKLALEAPVKLLAPLVAFIFPVVFLLLAFVLFMKAKLAGVL